MVKEFPFVIHTDITHNSRTSGDGNRTAEQDDYRHRGIIHFFFLVRLALDPGFLEFIKAAN